MEKLNVVLIGYGYWGSILENYIINHSSYNLYRKVLYNLSGFPATRILSKDIESKYKKSFIYNLYSSLDIISKYTSLPIIISLIICGIFLLLSITVFGYVIYALFFKDIISGWISSMLFNTMAFSMISITNITILVYLRILLQNSKSKSPYRFTSIDVIK